MPRSHTTELRSGCINTSLEGRGEESQEVIKLKYHSTESFGPFGVPNSQNVALPGLTGNRVGFSCPHLHKGSLPESRRAPPCLPGLAVYRKWRAKELQRLGHYPGVTSLQRVPCLPPASPPSPYRSAVPEAVLGSSLSGMLDRGRESALSARAPQKELKTALPCG